MPNRKSESFEVDIKDWKTLLKWLQDDSSEWWLFRGQGLYRWSLTPTVTRVIQNLLPSAFNHEAFENSIIGIFKREAKAILSSVPREDDVLGWLALMQHYRAPNRLLDWTYSPFIALYFAIESLDLTKDSAIWALNATVCAGAHIGQEPSKAWDHLGLVAMAKGKPNPSQYESFQSLQNMRIRKVITSKSRWPLPLVPEWTDPRMAAQQSVFTLAGDVMFPLERLRFKRNWQLNKLDVSDPPVKRVVPSMSKLAPEKVICKVRVPAGAKREALQYLHNLGITPAALFPGLEGIGRTVAQSHYKFVPLADHLTGDGPGIPLFP